MRPEKQEARRREIETAAYAVLAEKGFTGASMLAIAKRAGASNETLYKWYGSKQGLFRSMIEENARAVAELLQASISSDQDPMETLKKLGPLLLGLLVSDKAIALNRAAVADAEETGQLGQTLTEAGRESIAPLIGQVFEAARAKGLVAFGETREIVEVYVGLLVGDLQIRRAIGVCGVLAEEEIQGRSERALRLVFEIYGN